MRSPKKIIFGLELLRGICALLVAFGHILHWSGTVHFENWLVHGVACFFAISGAVLYYNYQDLPELDQFMVKRFARLFPLYALALLLTYIGHQYGMKWNVILNLSMIFGFFSNRCDVLGCWSLGVEFALYALFPILLAFMRSPKGIVAILALLMLLRVAGIEDAPGSLWWSFYAQPGTFIVLFFGGMAIAKYADVPRLPKWIWPVGALFSFAALFLYQTERHQVYGAEGVAMVGACLILTGCFWHLHTWSWLSRMLGDTSYGVYLLHPIVWGTLHTLLKLPLWVCLTATLPATLLFAWGVLRLYEKPVKRWVIKTYMGTREPNDR